MELDKKQQIIVIIVLLVVSLVGLTLACLFIFLDLFVPESSVTLPPNAGSGNLFTNLVSLNRKLDIITPELSTLSNFILSQIPRAGVINKGPLKIFDIEKCKQGQVDNCFFQNVSTPYSRFAWDNELPGDLSVLDVIPLSQRDVIVIQGLTPPPCAYWSFIPYILASKEDSCFGNILGAGLSDSVSNITTGWAPSTPFVIIMGTNNGAIQTVKSALEASGNAPAQLATQVFAYVGVGLYWIIGRTAFFESEIQQKEYMMDTRISGEIIRVPEASFDPAYTLTTPTYKPRNPAIDEKEIIGEANFEAQADDYLQSVLESLGGFYTAQEVPVSIAPFIPSGSYDNGADCIASCANCQIDNRDTVYFAGEVEDLAPGYYILVYSVNHSAYRKAIYSQISVNENTKAIGLEAVNYRPTDPDFTQVLVAQRTDAPDENTLPEGTQLLTVADDVTDVTITERAYIQPATSDNPSFGVSADPNTLIPMKVWLLSP